MSIIYAPLTFTGHARATVAMQPSACTPQPPRGPRHQGPTPGADPAAPSPEKPQERPLRRRKARTPCPLSGPSRGGWRILTCAGSTRAPAADSNLQTTALRKAASSQPPPPRGKKGWARGAPKLIVGRKSRDNHWTPGWTGELGGGATRAPRLSPRGEGRPVGGAWTP